MDQDASGWKTLLTRANQFVRSATHPAAQLPVEGHLPGFDGATGWLTAAELRGRVVLVNFWTYTCINWLRTLPYVRAWAETYQDRGLVVVGVHTPEFDFEHDLDNVRQEVKDLRVPYPVAVDNDYAIWSAFDNHYWPALYFVDAQGQIRHHRFGEGDDEQSEMVVQRLLTDAGAEGIDEDLVSVDARGVEAAADWDSHGAEPGRGADRLPLLRSRPPPGHGPAGTGNAGAVPRAARRAAAGRGPRGRCGRAGQWHPDRAAAVSARPPARAGHRRHLRGHLPDPGVQAYAFTFG
jgi:thiol-disulfide isomerase/thioredoxin